MSWVFPPPPLPSLAVRGREARFPVRRIYCVGRNYAEHVREMGGDPAGDAPLFFTKPADAIVADGAPIPYPPATRELHPEVELVVALGGGGRDIPVEAALDRVWGYAVGLDLTRRDLQREAKASGGPWDMSKGFDRSAPCGALAPASEVGHPARGAIRLRVNAVTRQESDVSALIWSVAEILSHLSRLVELAPGDLVFTGTPEGVAPVGRGDHLVGEVDGVGRVVTRIDG